MRLVSEPVLFQIIPFQSSKIVHRWSEKVAGVRGRQPPGKSRGVWGAARPPMSPRPEKILKLIKLRKSFIDGVRRSRGPGGGSPREKARGFGGRHAPQCPHDQKNIKINKKSKIKILEIFHFRSLFKFNIFSGRGDIGGRAAPQTPLLFLGGCRPWTPATFSLQL